jgi:hypothetical protein
VIGVPDTVLGEAIHAYGGVHGDTRRPGVGRGAVAAREEWVTVQRVLVNGRVVGAVEGSAR